MKLKGSSTKNNFGQMATQGSLKLQTKTIKHQQKRQQQQHQHHHQQHQFVQQHKVPIYNVNSQTLAATSSPVAALNGSTRPPLQPLSPASVMASARRFLPVSGMDNVDCSLGEPVASCTECSINCCCNNLMNSSCCYMPPVLMPINNGIGSSVSNTNNNFLTNSLLTGNSQQLCDDTPYVYQEPEENFVSIDDVKIKNFLINIGQQKQKQKLLQQKQLQQQQLLKQQHQLQLQQQQLQLQQQQLENLFGLEENYSNHQHLSIGGGSQLMNCNLSNNMNSDINSSQKSLMNSSNNDQRRPVVYEIIELDDEDERERLKRIKIQAEQSQLHKQIQSTLAKANTDIILESVRHPTKSLDISLIPKYSDKNVNVNNRMNESLSSTSGSTLRKRTAKPIITLESGPSNRKRLDSSKQRIIAEIDLLDSSSNSSNDDQQELSKNRVTFKNSINNSHPKGNKTNDFKTKRSTDGLNIKLAMNKSNKMRPKSKSKDINDKISAINKINYKNTDNNANVDEENEDSFTCMESEMDAKEVENGGAECEEDDNEVNEIDQEETNIDEQLNISNQNVHLNKVTDNKCIDGNEENHSEEEEEEEENEDNGGGNDEQRLKTESVSKNLLAKKNLSEKFNTDEVLVLNSDDDEQVPRQSGQEQVVRRWQEYRDHRGRLLFECFVCGRTVQSSYNLRRHMMIHTGERPFACDMCDRKFREFSDLKKHRRRHTTEKNFLCMICRKLRPMDNDPTRCINCCNQSKHAVLLSAMKTNSEKSEKASTKEMQEVITMLQNKVDNESKRASKKAKNMALTRQATLSQSAVETDSGASLSSPNVQVESVNSNDVVEKDVTVNVIIEADGEVEMEAETESEEDDEAEEESETEPEITAPIPDMTNKRAVQHFLDKIPAVRRRGYNQLGVICRKEFPCPLCKRSFGSRHNLKRHYMIHTGEKPYTCLQCRKPFREYSTLKKHMVTHQKDRWYKCMCCPCKFRDFVDFTEHKSTHPFLRTSSGNSIINNSLTVVNDYRSESGSNSPHLSKQSSRSADTNMQIKIQQNQSQNLMVEEEEASSSMEDWLECGGCGKYFIDMDKYTEHLQLGQCHVRIVHECYICKDQFHSRDLLNKHMKQHHNTSMSDLVEKEESGNDDDGDEEEDGSVEQDNIEEED